MILAMVNPMNGLKPVIIYDVVLGRNVASVEVADEANRFSMDRRESQELATTGTGLPFGDLATFFGETGF